MSIRQLTPPWGQDYIPGTLAGDPDAAFSLYVAMGNEQRGEAAVVLYQMAIPAPSYRAFLQGAWEHDHHHIMAAADLALVEMRALFDYADFDTSALPDRLTVWRGTAGLTRDEAAEGYSWTTNREQACWFAMRHAGVFGTPLVLRREVYRWEVAMFTSEREESEVVVLDEYDELPEIDGTPEEWRRIFEAMEPSQ